jgi:acetyl-CoA acetyltransferase
VVASRYGISRDAQDEYALQSQQRTAAAQAAGKLDHEIVPMPSSMGVMDRESGDISFHEVTLEKDEGNRPGTTLEGLAGLNPVREEGFITAGNASQLSDGASASVVMEARMAEKRGLEALGYYRGTAIAGCEPDEMGIGPVFAIPKLLERTGLTIDDIGL